jgi:glutamyl-tRNA reductase
MEHNETSNRRKPIKLKPHKLTLVTQIRLIPNKVYDKQVTKEGQNLMTFVASKKERLDKLTVLAFTHKHFYLGDLGKLVVEKQELAEKLQNTRVNRALGIEELFYLATCNRVEFVLNTPSGFTTTQAQELLETFYPNFSPTQISNLLQFAKIYRGKEAVRHIFQVSCSMDSMVIGEREISRQLRQAYEDARELGATGDFLRLLMKQAVRTSKEVYTETRIAAKPISVASLAVRKLIDYNLAPDAGIVLIGAGETNTLVAKYLKKAGYNNFTIYNRTLEKAQLLANYLGGVALPLTALNRHDRQVSVVISCTSSNEPLVTNEIWNQFHIESSFPAVVIDLAVPNDVAVSVRERADIEYISIETLKHEVEKNLEFRETELDKAAELIEKSIEDFAEMNRIRSVELALSNFPTQVKEIKKKAFDEVFAKDLSTVDAQTRVLIEKMMGYMEKKCISVPIVLAKQILLDNTVQEGETYMAIEKSRQTGKVA